MQEKLPKLGHKQVNMYLLFKHVVSAGGMQNVVRNEGTWANIFRQLPNYSPTGNFLLDSQIILFCCEVSFVVVVVVVVV